MDAWIQASATFCIGVFFAAAVYISLVQHPAALATGTDFASRFFSPMYSRASVMQATLAVVGTVAAATAYFSTERTAWIFVAVLISSVVPFTLLVMAKVNDELKAHSPDRSADRTSELLVRWGHLHWVRTIVSGLAFLGCLYLA